MMDEGQNGYAVNSISVFVQGYAEWSRVKDLQGDENCETEWRLETEEKIPKWRKKVSLYSISLPKTVRNSVRIRLVRLLDLQKSLLS